MNGLAERLAALPREKRVLFARRNPVSFAQQRLWLVDQLMPGEPVYNIPAAVRLRGPLDAAALARSLSEIVRRHEVLRTTFAEVEGLLVQLVGGAEELSLPVEDLTRLPEDEREAEALRLSNEDARRPFDLARGPLFRASLLRLGEEHHVLLVNMHHIVSDGWSLSVLIRELTTLYAAFSRGEESPLPELPIQYVDFAKWQREWLQGSVLEEQLTYWRRQLGDIPPALELPADRPRPAAPSHRGATITAAVSRQVTDRLNELSRREGATLFMTLLAAFQALLHRYTGQADIAVGTPIANRNRAETEGLIGFFVNTLVLRTDLSGDPSFRELVGRVREATVGAYDHQDVPFEKLVEELQPERGLSRQPLFQVMFGLQNAPRPAPSAPGLEVTPVKVGNRTAKFDLTLTAAEGEAGLALSMEYSSDLFEEPTVGRLLDSLKVLLASIAADPASPVGRLDLLTDGERQRLLVEFNDTQTDFAADVAVHLLFEEQAAARPEAVAVVSGAGRVTYGELNGSANRLARRLIDLGVGPDSLVGIYMERSVEMLAAVLGVLKAGGAYLPLDTQYPKRRLAYMLEDARPSVLLTQAALAGALPETTACVVRVDADPAGDEGEENPPARARGGNLAYVIYTSGSTGRPKGVMITHRNLSNYMKWCAETYVEAGAGGAPLHSPIGFDLTVTSVFAPLLAGQPVVLLEEGAGVGALAAALRDGGGFGLVKLTPAHLEVLNQQLTPAQAAGRTAAFVIGGEALSAESLELWRAHAPATRLFNEYGPTEATVGCCVREVRPGDARAGAVSIGRPIFNTQMYVLDAHLNPLPAGVAGELYIAGEGLARGYLNRPALTAERFVSNPFSREPGGRMYRTGDLARFLPDGGLVFLGRVDQQVKVRGFRIELGEIEAALSGHERVRECAAVARGDGGAGGRLVAYVVAQGAAEADELVPELRRFLKGRLPEYMIPSAFVLLDALPLTANGKVDRRALPEPDGARVVPSREFVAPRDALELRLKEIWEDVLGVRPVGVTDNFFELGGHSVLAVRLLSHVQQLASGGAGLAQPAREGLGLSALFRHPTVEGLAAALRQVSRVATPPLSPPQSCLVKLSEGDSAEPFFFVHPAGGNVFCYSELARRLGRERTFYGVQARG
ncbi:MAG TPA: amino acid adenylation domain-containing protein, partial [Pyrinomonadaceae bacterium]|nr:amino acid adenylation domain-containing protein [Pyrinomonadaceae bacterium]